MIFVVRLATCSTDIYSSLELKSSIVNRFWWVFFLHHILPHKNSLIVNGFVCKEKENCISGFLSKSQMLVTLQIQNVVCLILFISRKEIVIFILFD